MRVRVSPRPLTIRSPVSWTVFWYTFSMTRNDCDEEVTREEATEESGSSWWSMDRPWITIATILALGIILYLIDRFTGVDLR